MTVAEVPLHADVPTVGRTTANPHRRLEDLERRLKEVIGLRTNVPMEALPETTWRVLELVPDVVSTGTVLLGGIWWITNRRAEVARKEGRRK